MPRRCRTTAVLAAMALVAAGCASGVDYRTNKQPCPGGSFVRVGPPAPRPRADQKSSVQLSSDTMSARARRS